MIFTKSQNLRAAFFALAVCVSLGYVSLTTEAENAWTAGWTVKDGQGASPVEEVFSARGEIGLLFRHLTPRSHAGYGCISIIKNTKFTELRASEYRVKVKLNSTAGITGISLFFYAGDYGASIWKKISGKDLPPNRWLELGGNIICEPGKYEQAGWREEGRFEFQQICQWGLVITTCDPVNAKVGTYDLWLGKPELRPIEASQLSAPLKNNGLINGEFDHGLDGWTKTAGPGNIDITDERNGNKAVRCVPLKDHWTGITQKVKISPNSLYLLSFRVRTASVPGNAPYHWKVYFSGINDLGATSQPRERQGGDTCGQSSSQNIIFNTGTNDCGLQLMFGSYYQGTTAFFDDIDIQIITPDRIAAIEQKIREQNVRIFQDAIYLDTPQNQEIFNFVSDDTTSRNRKLLELFLREKKLEQTKVAVSAIQYPKTVAPGETFSVSVKTNQEQSTPHLYMALVSPQPWEPEATIFQHNFLNAFRDGKAMVKVSLSPWCNEGIYTIVALASPWDQVRLGWRGWILPHRIGEIQVKRRVPMPSSTPPPTQLQNFKGRTIFSINGQPVMPVLFSCGHSYFDFTWNQAVTRAGFSLLRYGDTYPQPGPNGRADLVRLDNNLFGRRLQSSSNHMIMFDTTVLNYNIPKTGRLLHLPEGEQLRQNASSTPPLLSGGNPIPSFASETYRQKLVEEAGRLTGHLSVAPYAGKIFSLFAQAENETYPPGYLSGGIGDYSEAMRGYFSSWLQHKYGTVEKLNGAWHRQLSSFQDVVIPELKRREAAGEKTFRNPQRDMDVIDFQEAYNDHLVDLSCALGNALRKNVTNRFLLATYYRLSPNAMESLNRLTCSNIALGRMLRNSAWDIIVGCPSRYYYHVGGVSIPPIAIDSYYLHGKLPLVEYDATGYMGQRNPRRGRLAEGGRQFNAKETIEIYKRDTAAFLIEGAGYYHMQFDEGNPFGQRKNISSRSFLIGGKTLTPLVLSDH